MIPKHIHINELRSMVEDRELVISMARREKCMLEAEIRRREGG
jgi:hypothetical protein